MAGGPWPRAHFFPSPAGALPEPEAGTPSTQSLALECRVTSSAPGCSRAPCPAEQQAARGPEAARSGTAVRLPSWGFLTLQARPRRQEPRRGGGRGARSGLQAARAPRLPAGVAQPSPRDWCMAEPRPCPALGARTGHPGGAEALGAAGQAAVVERVRLRGLPAPATEV